MDTLKGMMLRLGGGIAIVLMGMVVGNVVLTPEPVVAGGLCGLQICDTNNACNFSYMPWYCDIDYELGDITGYYPCTTQECPPDDGPCGSLGCPE